MKLSEFERWWIDLQRAGIIGNEEAKEFARRTFRGGI